MTGRLRTPGAWALLLGVLLLAIVPTLWLGASVAWAGDGDEPEAPAAEDGAEDGTLKADDLEAQLLAHAGARWALLLGRFLPIVIGVVLLILWLLKQDKIKGGVLPRPPPAEPTMAFSLGPAVLWAVVGLIVAPAILVVVIAGGVPTPSSPTWHTVVGMGVPTLCVAAFLLFRRRRVQQEPPAALLLRFGPGAPIPTQPPRMGRALGLGMWGVCVAGVIVVPAALAWALMLQQLGAEPMAQDPVRRVLEDPSHLAPILMAVFGVFVAPFTEECIFRGMLYPAIKHIAGGGKRGAWIGALIVSAIFAGVHGSLYAAVPLFMLALVLNWVFETTNSLAAVIFLHAFHNAMTMIPLLILRYAS